MQWGSVENFLNMGGYAPFVWGAYAMVAAAIVAEIVLVRARQRGALKAARSQAERDSMRKGA
jgi:heme exporter protein D